MLNFGLSPLSLMYSTKNNKDYWYYRHSLPAKLKNLLEQIAAACIKPLFEHSDSLVDITESIDAEFRFMQIYNCDNGSSHILHIFKNEKYILEIGADDRLLALLKKISDAATTLNLYKKYFGNLIVNKIAFEQPGRTFAEIEKRLAEACISDPSLDELWVYKVKLLHRDLGI
nr:hypothetical protein [Pseudomonas sp. s4]